MELHEVVKSCTTQVDHIARDIKRALDVDPKILYNGNNTINVGVILNDLEALLQWNNRMKEETKNVK